MATAAVAAWGEGEPALRVSVEVDPGPRYVGESFELKFAVIAGSEQPSIKLPTLAHGRIAVVETFSKALQASGIGRMVVLEKRHLFQCRVVADASGTLEIPPIEAQAKGKIGRSRPARIEIKAVPSDGRPAAFLGGVGRFSLEAEVEPEIVRVGEWVVYKIRAAGPGAIGMTERPSLSRFKQLAIPLEIRAGRDQSSFEPPSRTFVYEIRPLSAGEIVLPPVSVAAFDPAVKRYMTQASHGQALRAVAVPALDASTIAPVESDESSERNAWIAVLATAMVLLSAAAFPIVRSMRRRKALGSRTARRYALRVARLLRAAGKRDTVGAHQPARVFWDFLGGYLAAGQGRPAGALAPDEVRQGVMEVAGSPELAEHAARLAEACDQWLFGPDDARPPIVELHEAALRLFEALGKARIHSIREARIISSPPAEQAGTRDRDR